MKRILICLILVSVLTGCRTSQQALAFAEDADTQAYTFVWAESDTAYADQLRTEFGLDELIGECKDDMEIIIKVTDWVHNLWEHDGSNQPEKADPISILRDVQQGQQFRCVEYSIVISGCLNALGLPSRIVGLKTKDVETREFGAGHVVVETYVAEIDKWVMVDGQWNIVPVIEGTPLHCVELQKAIAEQRDTITTLQNTGACPSDYLEWIEPYLYYFDIKLDNRIVDRESNTGLMLVPIGAKEPKVFQKEWPIQDMLYTHSTAAFYPVP